MKTIDNCGLSCPEPVLRTIKALAENPLGLISVVDNEAARENVIRMAKNEGFSARWEEEKGLYHIYITAGTGQTGGKPAAVPPPAVSPGQQEQIIFIGSEQFGRGSEELGKLLMRNYIYTLTEGTAFPGAIIFVNSGVRLCVEGSAVLEELAELQHRGTKILVCGTCLDYFDLAEKLAAGNVSNMYEISELLAAAPRVLSL